jgi:hypothetical protein
MSELKRDSNFLQNYQGYEMSASLEMVADTIRMLVMTVMSADGIYGGMMDRENAFLVEALKQDSRASTAPGGGPSAAKQIQMADQASQNAVRTNTELLKQFKTHEDNSILRMAQVLRALEAEHQETLAEHLKQNVSEEEVVEEGGVKLDEILAQADTLGGAENYDQIGNTSSDVKELLGALLSDGNSQDAEGINWMNKLAEQQNEEEKAQLASFDDAAQKWADLERNDTETLRNVSAGVEATKEKSKQEVAKGEARVKLALYKILKRALGIKDVPDDGGSLLEARMSPRLAALVQENQRLAVQHLSLDKQQHQLGAEVKHVAALEQELRAHDQPHGLLASAWSRIMR